MVRVKNRYLVVNYLYPTPVEEKKTINENVPQLIQFHRPTTDKFDSKALFHCIRDGITELFGDYGMGMAGQGLKINYHSPATSTSIIRCPQAHYHMVWAALTSITTLGKLDIPVVVRVVRVSGTIRKAEEEVIERAKDIILRARLAERGSNGGPVAEIVKATAIAGRNEKEVLAGEESMGSEDESD